MRAAAMRHACCSRHRRRLLRALGAQRAGRRRVRHSAVRNSQPVIVYRCERPLSLAPTPAWRTGTIERRLRCWKWASQQRHRLSTARPYGGHVGYERCTFGVDGASAIVAFPARPQRHTRAASNRMPMRARRKWLRQPSPWPAHRLSPVKSSPALPADARMSPASGNHQISNGQRMRPAWIASDDQPGAVARSASACE